MGIVLGNILGLLLLVCLIAVPFVLVAAYVIARNAVLRETRQDSNGSCCSLLE